MRRSTLLYVILDRPEDAGPADHQPNVDGVSMAVAGFDPGCRVEVVTIDDFAGMTATDLDTRYDPLALFGAGSFSEWFHHGDDPAWRSRLDRWMEIVRQTTLPMLAVCGSHQLVAAAFSGFFAIAHMTDRGAPIPIADEIASSPPTPRIPRPRIGEQGTYPIVATSIGADDPIVRIAGTDPMVSLHHSDMVIDTRGFDLVYVGDPDRPASTTASNQPRSRCRVQGMKIARSDRILYSVQFHPEIARFGEATEDDGGFGQRFLGAFLSVARAWWTDRS